MHPPTMGIPKKLSRKTSHAKPKHQLYQPGFNPSNSCWLQGRWITLPKAEWQKRRAAHEKLYAIVFQREKTQHYKFKPTPLKKMTRAQKQAWEYYSGDQRLAGIVNGRFAPFVVRMAGKEPQPSQITWLRNRQVTIPRWIKLGPKGKPENQLRSIKLPKDLIQENTPETALDEVTATVTQNRARSQEFFDAAADNLEKNDHTRFSISMAFGQLIEQEELIIRAEWQISRGEEDTIPYEPEKERQLYVAMRSKLKNYEGFAEGYERAKANHNECERANLDNSDGKFFCFVLPEFHDDGTHEPVGEHDVPWSQPLPKKPKAKNGVENHP
jgi:hypothetical protein